MTAAAGPIMCPSSACAPGAQVIAVVVGQGLAYLSPAAAVDDRFVAAAAADPRPADARFRFSAPCAGQECGHWERGRCGLGDVVTEVVIGRRRQAEGVPGEECAIRERCRWRLQSGDLACGGCPVVRRTRLPSQA